MGKQIMPVCLRLCAAMCVASTAASATPIITAGHIATPAVSVAKPPPAPLVTLQITGTAVSATFLWVGPSGQIFTQAFSGGPWTGGTNFQGYTIYTQPTLGPAAFSLYTQPGTWALASITLCSKPPAATCSNYSASQLVPLFDGLTVQISNPNPGDTQAPVATAAVVDTPGVSLSAGGLAKIGIAATDNLSGIFTVNACAGIPGTVAEFCFGSLYPSAIILSKTFFMTAQLPAGTPTGTYIVNAVSLSDLAGNTAYITNAAIIAKLFHGQDSIVVTN